MGNNGKNYYISDLHINHKNVTAEGRNFDNRPFQTLEEMHEKIKENWNNTITNADTVYILGDMCWIENDEGISLISTLKGKKVLIKGNHDKVTDLRYKTLYQEICDYKEIQYVLNGVKIQIILSHYPIASWKSMRTEKDNGEKVKKYSIHLYGHVHNTKEYELYQEYINNLSKNGIKTKSYNVGCMLEYMNYTPRTLEEIIELNNNNNNNNI